MTSPFPGMDPYLEAHWGDIQASLAPYARNQLNRQLPAGLYATVEEYLAIEVEGKILAPGYSPDVQVREKHHLDAESGRAAGAGGIALAEPVVVSIQAEPLTLREVLIYDRATGDRLLTAIEFLSPANKVGRAGRRKYRRKQKVFRAAKVNLVEVDLIRQGRYVLVPPEQCLPPDCREPYRITVVEGGKPGSAVAYRVSLRERLPAIGIPLRQNDPVVGLDLQQLIAQAYEDGRYGSRLDYRKDPVPPLQGDDAVWTDQLLRDKGLR